jgi:hypothetical protein
MVAVSDGAAVVTLPTDTQILIAYPGVRLAVVTTFASIMVRGGAVR